MIVIGVDAHKADMTLVAVCACTGRYDGEIVVRARRDGFEAALEWARALESDAQRVWALEDCRHVTGSLERWLIVRGEAVIRVPPQLTAGARGELQRQRGKSDPIDALAVARVVVRDGIDAFPVARLAGIERDIRLLKDHRAALVGERTRHINRLRWHLHDLWPDFQVPQRALAGARQQARVDGKLKRAQQTVQVAVARDELRRIRELTRTIDELARQLEKLTAQAAPNLTADTGCGPITAAIFIGHIAGIDRFKTDAQLARLAGSAPIPAWSGATNGQVRLDRGGDRQLNYALHLYALARIRYDPDTRAFYQRTLDRKKSRKAALRILKRHLVRRVFQLLQTDAQTTAPLT